MSEHNSIFNINGELVGRFRHGVAWSSPGMQRLGEYDKECVYDNDGIMIAKINNGRVLNTMGEKLGHISGKEIFVADIKVGSFIGLAESGAASIAFIFNADGDSY